MVVMHRHFGNPEAGVLDLLHHLEADDAAVLLERHRVEDRPAHQPEVTVHVAHPQAEQKLHRVVIDPADHDAMNRIRSADLVAVDHVHIIGEAFPEDVHFGGIVLRIAIRVEDQITSGRFETAAQRTAVAAIARMVYDLDFGVIARELVRDTGGAIDAAVVDDDDFEVVVSFRAAWIAAMTRLAIVPLSL